MPESPFEILKAANRLPTPAGVAMRILELVESEETSLDDLGQVIGSDPALTSKILKYINSPLMGLGFHGATLQEAVARIGMRGAQMMALSFSLVSEKQRESCPSFNFDRFWSESLVRAVAARSLATHLMSWDAEEAFLTGLLCRIGKLACATGMAAVYEPVLRDSAEGGPTLEERERAALGADHLETGLLLLREWHLPEVVWRTAGHLATPASADGHEMRSVAIVRLADAVAAFMVDERRHNAAAIRELCALAEERFEIDAETFRTLLGRVGLDWINYGRLLSVQTQRPPDVAAIESQAEEHRAALRIASEVEVQHLRSENEQLGRFARRDRLTGLLNRAAFDEALSAALATAAQERRPLALLLIDADRFRAFNARYGHAGGDAALEQIARLVEASAGPHDSAFRCEGDEFAVLAPRCATAAALAEKIRADIEAASFGEGAGARLTVSIGVVVSQGSRKPGHERELLERAEQRLADARHSGGNRWRDESLRGHGPGFWRRVSRWLPAGGR